MLLGTCIIKYLQHLSFCGPINVYAELLKFIHKFVIFIHCYLYTYLGLHTVVSVFLFLLFSPFFSILRMFADFFHLFAHLVSQFYLFSYSRETPIRYLWYRFFRLFSMEWTPSVSIFSVLLIPLFLILLRLIILH